MTEDGHGDDCVIAVFPDGPANAGMVGMYAHIGQHGEASLEYIETNCRAATETEYAELHSEYSGIVMKYDGATISIVPASDYFDLRADR